MIIGVCGFTSTGSSAVSDFLKELSTTDVVDNLEFTLVYQPDGLEDLDYHLNQGSTKYNSSVVAITRFRRATKYSLYNITNGKIVDFVDNFLGSIVQTKWLGYGGTDYVLYNNWFYRNIGVRLFKSRLLPILTKHNLKYRYFPQRTMEFSANPINFDENSKELVKEILGLFRKDLTKPLILDQPFAGNNPQKSFKFFDNPYAIIVDRDPRDNYLFAKYFLKTVGKQIPTDTVESFVSYYKNMRDNMPYKEKHPRILRIQFEDMIYDYEDTTRKIVEFLNLKLEDRYRTIFSPELSIENTQLFLRYGEKEKDNIAYIERELSEYLYDFDRFPNTKPKLGKMFYGKSPLNK